jgi:two-component system, chemotaxis family, protein-glutamate methylesterase/glutaminase
MPQRDIVVIGGSAGAIESASEIARALPADFPAAIFVVVHFPGSVTSALPRILSRAGVLPAEHARDEALIQPGRIYVAPPDCHLFLDEGRLRVSRGPKENGHRPAIDPLFRSAAHHYGGRVIGVLLSGNLSDGTAGMLTIKQRGGIAVVQDPESALYPGMPRSAIERVRVDHVLPVSAIPQLLTELTADRARPRKEQGMDLPDPVDKSTHETMDEAATEDRKTQVGIPSTMSCPECHGVLWEHRDGKVLAFRCRVGHAFTEEALLAIQAEQLEAALWTALRALEEHAALSRRMATRAGHRGHSHSASTFTEHAMDAEHHASTIRTVLASGVRGNVAAASVLEPELE